MPKIQKLRQPKQVGFHPYDQNGESEESMKHLNKTQKKRAEKQLQVQRKLGLVAPEFKNKFIIKSSNKPALVEEDEEDDEEDVPNKEETIPQITNNQNHNQTNSGAISNKAKKQIAIKESLRMKEIQSDPLFQSNPIEAVNQHIQKMLAQSQANKK